MTTTPKILGVTLLLMCLFPALAFGQFQQTCAHGSSGDNCPDLVYDPSDGAVTLDPDGQNPDPNDTRDRAINAFAILHTGNPAWNFQTDIAVPNVGGLPAGGSFDFIPNQFGWVSGSTSVGFKTAQVLGPLFPTGLDLAGLQAFLKNGAVSFGNDIVPGAFPNPPSGGGGGTFGLIVPEPTTLTLIVLSLMSMVVFRQQRS